MDECDVIVIPSSIDVETAKTAPEEIPPINGSTRGFLKIPCITTPAVAREEPITIAVIILGILVLQITSTPYILLQRKLRRVKIHGRSSIFKSITPEKRDNILEANNARNPVKIIKIKVFFLYFMKDSSTISSTLT